MIADRLTDVTAAVERGDDGMAIDLLLAAWTDYRHEACARAIELVDLCAAGLGSIAAADDPGEPAKLVAASTLERGPLLRRVASCPIDVLADPHAWLDALSQLPLDPRVTMALDRIEGLLPLVWEDEHDDAGRTDDPKLDLRDPVTAKYHALQVRHRDVQNILPDGVEATLFQIEMTLRRRLFDDAADTRASAAFAANQDDDTARLAYADWLTARGDLRGARLRDASAPDHVLASLWQGPIGRIAYVPLELGWSPLVRFYDDKRVIPGEPDWRALEVGWRPGWSAIRRLHQPPLALLTSVELPMLRVLGCRRDRLEAAIAAGVRFCDLELLAMNRWCASGFLPDPSDAKRVQSLLRKPALRGLRHLSLHTYAEHKRELDGLVAAISLLLADPCGLDTLTVHCASREWFWVPSALWFQATRAAESPLRLFRATGDAGERWLFGGAASPDVKVEWWSDPNLFTVERVAEVVAAGATQIVVVATKELTPGIVAALRKLRCELRIETDPALANDRFDR